MGRPAKNFQKPLDKRPIMRYNKRVRKRKATSQTRKATAMRITPEMLHDVNSKYHLTYVYFFSPDHSLEQIRYRLELLSHIGMMFNKGEGFTAESCGLDGQNISIMAGDADNYGFPHNLPFSRVTQEKVTIHINMLTYFGREEIEKEVPRWIYRMEWDSEEIAEFVKAVYTDLGIVRR